MELYNFFLNNNNTLTMQDINAYNALKQAGIYSVKQIRELSNEELLRLQGIGQAEVERILFRVSEHKLKG